MTAAEARTRDRIVNAARDLFLRNGYGATGRAEILKDVDVTRGSLYHYFTTKEDLLLAVLDWYRTHIWTDLLNPIWDRIDDPIERIFGLLDGYRQMLQFTEFSMGCPIGNLALELSDTHPSARQLITQNFTLWMGAVQQCLDEAAGRMPDGADLKQLSTFVLTTMEGAMMLARSYRSMEPFDAAVTQLRDYFERLLKDGSDWSTPRRHEPQNR
jgi:AcrR family transcriptional regulator